MSSSHPPATKLLTKNNEQQQQLDQDSSGLMLSSSLGTLSSITSERDSDEHSPRYIRATRRYEDENEQLSKNKNECNYRPKTTTDCGTISSGYHRLYPKPTRNTPTTNHSHYFSWD